MAFVPVPKDLNRVKTKVMFNLTQKYIDHVVRSMILRDRVRPYRTSNLYAVIQQEIKEQEELHEQQQKKTAAPHDRKKR